MYKGRVKIQSILCPTDVNDLIDWNAKDARKYELNMPFKVYERMMELLIIDKECPSESKQAS